MVVSRTAFKAMSLLEIVPARAIWPKLNTTNT